MSRIRSLRANVTRSDAEEYFRGRLSLGTFLHGPIQSVADLYIPFRLFEVSVVNRNRNKKHVFGLETVQGILDLYEFPAVPRDQELVAVETRNVLPSRLDGETAKQAVLAKVRRLIFSRGFFALRDVRFETQEIPGEICVPYWVGFRGSDGQIRLSVLDAIRRRPEGAKVRQLVEQWLQAA